MSNLSILLVSLGLVAQSSLLALPVALVVLSYSGRSVRIRATRERVVLTAVDGRATLVALGLLGLVGLQAVSGLFAADEDRLVIDGPFVKFVSDATVSFAAKWHHRIFDAIEILVLLHVAANLFATFVKREPLIQGMATGYKPVEPYADEARARPGSWAAAAVCLAIAAAVVFGGILAAGGRL